ncbi:hypothetical protein F4001_11315, partial [Candidatus Poribacteria bacterium]|nr:hypothetical protein [Candidatus Poribacteria bacterium]
IHIRLNPTRKDIFIYSPSHLGIGYASDLRKKIFDIHEILESETKNKKKDRTVNFNSLGTPIQFRAGENEPWRVMAKKAIWIEDDLSETVEIPGESHGDGTISIYTKYIENETLGLMTSTDRRGCPWTDAEDAENKYTAKALGHEIGHAIGLKHPWESGVGVNVNGNVVGRVPQPNPVIPNLDLATNAKGWIGLYAFDNQTSPIDEIKRRSKIFKAWSDLEKNAQTAGSNAGLLGGIEKKKEAIATYRKRPDYQAALKKRNYYWQAPDADPYGENNDTVFSLKRHNHISGKVTTSEGPFTYTYGTTIMDYDFFAHGPGNKLQGIYTPSPSDDDADAVYPSFHNWEYDLGVPAPRAGIVWTPRPNPVPVPCGGTPVEQPEQPPTTPSNSGSEESGSNQNTQPPTPTDLLLTSENGQVRLSWTPVSGTVTDYEYRYRESGGSWDDDNWISMILSDPDVLTDTEFLVLSLINGTTYEFELRAMNGEIASAATESSESTPATVPGEPTSLVGDRYNQGVTLRWYPPDDDGGADVTEYQYRYSYTYGTYRSWTTVRGQNNGPNSGPKRSVSIGGLTNGRQYQFQVRAKNSAGYGAESLTIYKTPATTPSAPQNLTAPVGDGEVSLDWEPPNSNGGLKITEYKYSYRESSSDSWDTEGSAGTEQEKTITGLTNGTEYEFRVRAKNRMGLGPWSDTLSATPQPPPVWSDIPDPYNLTVGDSFSLDLSIYVTGSPTITRTSGRIPAGLSLSNGVLSGTVTTVESRGLQFTATNSAGSAKSEWVQIDVTAASTPTVTAPVWSDIPDPYNLTVGDSFYLDLNSYVTGSPTFTRNARTDGGYPIGTSVSNGVISGTVTRVHSRGFRFKATNSAGSAYSEWIQVNVTARP